MRKVQLFLSSFYHIILCAGLQFQYACANTLYRENEKSSAVLIVFLIQCWINHFVARSFLTQIIVWVMQQANVCASYKESYSTILIILKEVENTT